MVENIRGEVISAAGRTIKFGTDTGMLCPVCGNQSKSTLKVVNCIDHMEYIECPNCGYADHRPERPPQPVAASPAPAPVSKPARVKPVSKKKVVKKPKHK